jgi:S1-C subfamily serine protease
MNWIKENRFKLVALAMLIVTGFLIYFYYGTYLPKKEQALLSLQIEQQNQKLEKAKQNKQKNQLETLQNELDILKNQKPQVITQTVVKEKTETIIKEPPNSSPIDFASVIKKWTPYVAYIECTFVVSKKVLIGSGFYIPMSDGNQWIITNKHVVTIDEGKTFGADYCTVKLPNYTEIITIPNEGIKTVDYQDVGALIFDKNTVKNIIPEENIIPDPDICKNPPSVGDTVIILGYPAIGSTQGLTATEGIISGYDGDYYVTSAKIEHGNSGGIAVSPENSCYIGIPSAAVVGEIESLGRIFDIHKAEWFKNAVW